MGVQEKKLPSQCKHLNFRCECDVNRLEDSGRFCLDLRVRCTDCDLPFQFKGLPVGLDLNGAAISVDGLEAHLAISPQGQEPSPFDKGLVNGFRVRQLIDH